MSTWQTPQESIQPFNAVIAFTYTSGAANDVATNAVTLSGRMNLGSTLSLMVDNNDCYINFDNDAARPTGSPSATRDGVLIRAGTGYSAEKLGLRTRISAITAVNAASFTLRGVIWGY